MFPSIIISFQSIAYQIINESELRTTGYGFLFIILNEIRSLFTSKVLSIPSLLSQSTISIINSLLNVIFTIKKKISKFIDVTNVSDKNFLILKRMTHISYASLQCFHFKRNKKVESRFEFFIAIFTKNSFIETRINRQSRTKKFFKFFSPRLPSI